MTKALKLTTIVVTFLIGCITFSGCEKSSASEPPITSGVNRQTETDNSNNNLHESSDKEQILDSIKVINSRIEILESNQESQKINIDKLTKDVSDMKGTFHLLVLTSCVFAVILLIVAIIALVYNKAQGRHHKHIDDSWKRLKDLEQKPTMVPRTSNSGLNNKEYNLLSSRIEKLERQLEKMTMIPTHAPAPTNTDTGEQSHEQIGYFNLPSQISPTKAYFKRFYESRDSDSRFSVTIRDNKAEFRPLEGTPYLNEIKSNDTLRLALEFQGCALSEATQMEVSMPGEAKKEDGRWIIEKKASIILTR